MYSGSFSFSSSLALRPVRAGARHTVTVTPLHLAWGSSAALPAVLAEAVRREKQWEACERASGNTTIVDGMLAGSY